MKVLKAPNYHDLPASDTKTPRLRMYDQQKGRENVGRCLVLGAEGIPKAHIFLKVSLVRRANKASPPQTRAKRATDGYADQPISKVEQT